jgi:putative nucleotidyltransferase with HDIG domain
MDKSEALNLLHQKMQSINLRKHCYSVAAVMRALALHLGENPDKWEIAGILHDADYEEFPDTHPSVILQELENKKIDPEIVSAIRTHAWGYHDGYPEPKTKFEWSLYCCDELTGLIVACALVRPDKKLASVDLDAVKKKWTQKSFAAGVDRTQIELCEEKLGIKLDEFIEIALKAMQSVSAELGL